MDIEEIKVLCTKHGIHPSKKYGQNFVIDANVILMMVEHANVNANDCVVEVGPGFGALTKELAARVGKVLAVEVDKKMFAAAQELLALYKNVELVRGDILKMTNQRLAELLIGHPERVSAKGGCASGAEGSHTVQDRGSLHSARASVEMTKLKKYKVVANLPYSITSAVLRKFTEYEPRPTLCVFMVQREVAERVCASPGEMSILSVAVQYYGKPEIVEYVPRTAFWPEPEVDSAILRIAVAKESKVENVTKEFEKRLFQIVRMGFSSRRKQLQNNLSAGLRVSREKVLAAIGQAGLDAQVRAQDLSIENWVNLAQVLDAYK